MTDSINTGLLNPSEGWDTAGTSAYGVTLRCVCSVVTWGNSPLLTPPVPSHHSSFPCSPQLSHSMSREPPVSRAHPGHHSWTLRGVPGLHRSRRHRVKPLVQPRPLSPSDPRPSSRTKASGQPGPPGSCRNCLSRGSVRTSGHSGV